MQSLCASLSSKCFIPSPVARNVRAQVASDPVKIPGTFSKVNCFQSVLEGSGVVRQPPFLAPHDDD